MRIKQAKWFLTYGIYRVHRSKKRAAAAAADYDDDADDDDNGNDINGENGNDDVS